MEMYISDLCVLVDTIGEVEVLRCSVENKSEISSIEKIAPVWEDSTYEEAPASMVLAL